MKKILFATSLLAVAGAVNAGTLNSGANPVTTSDCTLLSAAVSITLSNGNVGGYICNGTTANIGVGVGSTTGKNKVFSIGSSGGALVTTTLAAAPVATDAEAAASTSAASSS